MDPLFDFIKFLAVMCASWTVDALLGSWAVTLMALAATLPIVAYFGWMAWNFWRSGLIVAYVTRSLEVPKSIINSRPKSRGWTPEQQRILLEALEIAQQR